MSVSYSEIYAGDAIFECVFSHMPSMPTHFVDNAFRNPKGYLYLSTHYDLAAYVV